MSAAGDGAPPPIPEFARRSAVIADAFRFAAVAHDGARGRGRTKIAHPTEVARLIAGAGYPDHVVAAALLHDVVEDTSIPIAEIEARFGERIATLVAVLTEDPAIEAFEPRKAALRERAVRGGADAAAVFAADKLAGTRRLRRAGAHLAPPEKLEHYERSLVTLRARHPGLPFLDDLEAELRELRGVAAPAGLRHQPPLVHAVRTAPPVAQPFLVAQWSAPVPDERDPRLPDARDLLDLESAARLLMEAIETERTGAAEDDARRLAWWRGFLADLRDGDYFAVDLDSGGHLHATRLRAG